jgi:hypothetical protein
MAPINTLFVYYYYHYCYSKLPKDLTNFIPETIENQHRTTESCAMVMNNLTVELKCAKL